MNDAASSTDRTDALGVVDPLRIPGLARGRRLWLDLPRLSRVFVMLAAGDVVVRAIGLLGTSLFLEITEPVTWITAFLPHDALILLPAVIAARRPNAMTEVPLVVRGAVTVALVELLRDPLGNLASGLAVDQIRPSVVLAMAAAIASAAGWIAIARGMFPFMPRRPTDTAAALAGFVAGGLAIGAIVTAGSTTFFTRLDLDDPGLTALLQLSNVVVALSTLGLAYLAWVVIRGAGDPNRPALAANLATISLAGLAIGAILLWFGGQGPLWFVIVLTTHTAAWTGLVVAFGLGLADPSGRIEPAMPTEQPATA